MRVASFNVENLFDRAKAMKLAWADGREILERYERINQLLTKPVYSDADKAEIKDLLRRLGLAKKDDGGRYAELRQARGRLLRRPKRRRVGCVNSVVADLQGYPGSGDDGQRLRCAMSVDQREA